MESSLGRDDSSSHETPFISKESELLERAGLSYPPLTSSHVIPLSSTYNHQHNVNHSLKCGLTKGLSPGHSTCCHRTLEPPEL